MEKFKENREIKKLREHNQFLAQMMLLEFNPSSYCLTATEKTKLQECYDYAFSSNSPVLASEE
jgi:hypothetical protein